MSKKDVFEQLADNLDDIERKAMLDEIREDLKKHSQVENRETGREQKKEREFKLLEKEYNESGLLDKIQLFIKKLFTGKPIYTLMKEKMLKSL